MERGNGAGGRREEGGGRRRKGEGLTGLCKKGDRVEHRERKITAVCSIVNFSAFVYSRTRYGRVGNAPLPPTHAT